MAELTSEQKRRLLRLLRDTKKVFAAHSWGIGEYKVGTHRIETGNAKPTHCNTQRMAYHFRGVLREELNEFPKYGIIKPSSSPWAATITYVPKKGGTWRFCVDFRKLNAVAQPCAYPLPHIEAIFDTLEGSRHFTCIDLNKGFWQLMLDPDSKQKAAFTTIYGQYQYRRVPLGLATTPGAFQKALNTVLAGLNRVHCMVYVDDILVFSPTFDRHLRTIEAALDRLIENDLKIKAIKCDFARTWGCGTTKYLGHVLNSKGKGPDPAKTEAISALGGLAELNVVESFLGKVGYYQKIIPDYSNLC